VYGAVVFIPSPGVPLPDLTAMPVGCGCAPLYPLEVQAAATTDVLGHYQLTNVPAGPLSLVVQSNKFRRVFDGLSVDPCTSTVINLRLPANSAEGDLPRIAVATGGGDSLECLPLRMGISASEYSSPTGHVSLFAGQNGATVRDPALTPVAPLLWSSAAQLSGYDVVMLSCEGAPTANVTDQSRQALVNYANAGGMVYASHLQAEWFLSGPLGGKVANFADAGEVSLGAGGSLPAVVDTTLSNGATSPEGTALGSWLESPQVSGQATLDLWFAHGQILQAISPPSTLWANLASTSPQAPGAPEVLSVDMPLGATAEAVCGRITFTDYHVSGGPAGAPGPAGGDYAGVDAGPKIAPDGCAMRPLSLQERVLEFSLLETKICLNPGGQHGPPVPLPR
jgi:hypothetical protein